MLDALPDEAAPLDEDGRPLSRAAWAASIGVTTARLCQMLQAERRGHADWARPGPEELPYVAIVEAPEPRLHYRLDDDEQSRLPDCPFRIGTARGRSLQVAHRDDRKGEPPAKPKPSRHKFRPKRPKKKGMP